MQETKDKKSRKESGGPEPENYFCDEEQNNGSLKKLYQVQDWYA